MSDDAAFNSGFVLGVLVGIIGTVVILFAGLLGHAMAIVDRAGR